MGSKKVSETQIEKFNRRAVEVQSKNWTPAQWEQYLESIDEPLKERDLIPSDQVDECQPFNWDYKPCSEEVVIFVRDLLSRLTPKQKLVIEKIYFDGRSERQIARKIQISRQGVFDLKKRALKKLKKMARKSLAKMPISEGQSSESPSALGIETLGKEITNVGRR